MNTMLSANQKCGLNSPLILASYVRLVSLVTISGYAKKRFKGMKSPYLTRFPIGIVTVEYIHTYICTLILTLKQIIVISFISIIRLK